MTNKTKLLFTAGLAVAVTAYVLKSQAKNQDIKDISALALPGGLVFSTIVLLSNTD